LTPTPDFSGAENGFTRAQQLIAAQDWPNALAALDQVRKLDPTYKTSQVDGMYFFALRNYGMSLIGQGNLEGGIYHITLAERFGPIDNNAHIMRDNARLYLVGASFWELDWRLAVEYFSALGGSNLWDGTMTATQRLHYAYMRYGDKLFESGANCEAVEMYKNAQAINLLDDTAAKNNNKAYQTCYPATAIVPTTAVATTETTSVTSTEPPTQAPTEPPTAAPTEPTP
jgi:tetratricopeptide (TPR) repeat protein